MGMPIRAGICLDVIFHRHFFSGGGGGGREAGCQFINVDFMVFLLYKAP